MVRQLLCFAVCLSVCVALAGAEPPKADTPTVTPVYLSVSRKLDEKRFGFTTSSTALSLQVEYPGKAFLSIDPSSTIGEWKDDKGTSLLGTGFFKTAFGGLPRISPDKTALIVYVNSNTAPAKGATKVHLKGNLVVKCGSEPKTLEAAEDVDFKDKAEAKIGDYTFRVVQEKGFGDFGGTFSIIAPSPNVKGVTVKDEAGKDLEVINPTSFGFGKNWTYSWGLRKPAKKVKVAVTYFSKEEKVTVPIDLDADLGL